MDHWTYLLRYAGREIPLSEGDIVLGRSRSCGVRVDEETVSRSHALLSLRGGQAMVRDLGSSNGLFVNGQRALRESPVRNGDVIGLGSATLSIVILPPYDERYVEALIDSSEGGAPAPAPRGAAAIDPAFGDVEDLTLKKVPEEDVAVALQKPPAARPSRAAVAVPVSSPSATPVPRPPASPGRRLVSALIDLGVAVLIALACFSFALVAIFARASLREGGGADPIYWVLIGYCACLAVACTSVYFLSGWAGRGATFGQRRMGLRLISESGGHVRSGAVLLRLLGLLLYLATGGLLALTIFFNPERRGLADKMSRSRVVAA